MPRRNRAELNGAKESINNSKDPASPFANKKVREAIEYAIDRKVMAEAIGFGFQVPVCQPTHKGTTGYNPDYPVCAYNLEKAR